MTKPKGSTSSGQPKMEEEDAARPMLLAVLRRVDLRLHERRTFRLGSGAGRLCNHRFRSSGFRSRGCSVILLRCFLLVEISYPPCHIGPGLVVRRHALVLLDALRPGIVGGQRL